MNLCVRTDACGNDPERVAQYCEGLGIREVWSFPEFAEGYGADGLMAADGLRAYEEQWRRRGLHLAMVSEMVDDADLASDPGAQAKIARLRSVLTAMQAAEVEALFVVLNIRAAGAEAEREAQWRRLAAICRDAAAHAETTTGRRLVYHGHQTPEHLVFRAAELERLLSLAPSPANGITFCTGCLQLAGDDLGGWVERFGTERIFFVHMRDVRARPDGGFDEVRFGEGEVALGTVVERLRAIGYDGPICPEHIPRVAYDPHEEISTAWGLGYLRALLANDAGAPARPGQRR